MNILNTRCPKCGGSIYQQSDQYGQYIACRHCAWCRDNDVGKPIVKTWDHAEDLAMADGCIVSASCLTCPLPDCAYESGIPRVTYVRDRQILAELAKHQHLPLTQAVEEVAVALGTTGRSVFRTLARVKKRQDDAA